MSVQGTTLRGLLLEAYAFATVGSIMLVGAIAAFILAAIMATLVRFGIWHARRTDETVPVLRARRTPVTA